MSAISGFSVRSSSTSSIGVNADAFMPIFGIAIAAIGQNGPVAVLSTMGIRVLVADDFSDARAMARFVLQEEGYEVIEASDGFEAVKKAVEEHPDLILMDITMPVMDGIQATQAIRLHEHLDSVPILAVTSYGDFYSERAREVGCNDLIQKPVDINNLRAVVNDYVH
jgi:CheY-like chemotaxis protein